MPDEGGGLRRPSNGARERLKDNRNVSLDKITFVRLESNAAFSVKFDVLKHDL